MWQTSAGRGAGKRAEILNRRRRRRRIVAVFFVLCCVLAFVFGKMVGKAEREQKLKIAEKKKLIEALYDKFEEEEELEPAGGEKRKDDGEKGNYKKISGTDADAGGQTDILMLVNRDNPLPADYSPELVTLQDGVHKSAKIAYGSLCDMLRAGIREGLTFEICSAYRSTERQRQLFEEDVNALTARGWSYESAYEEVARETMPPGCSEHNTGLAFDIVSFDYQLLDAGQEDTPENIWLREHCAEYGFILRYPRGTEDITGISYESWHFRYVGKEAAEYIMEQGITLEEYLQGARG